jgi:hypothetical protein
MTFDYNEDNLPVKLDELIQSYEKTITDFEKELLTFDQAMQTIENTRCSDGEGKVWRLNEKRQFVMSPTGSGPFFPASVDVWVTHEGVEAAAPAGALPAMGQTSQVAPDAPPFAQEKIVSEDETKTPRDPVNVKEFVQKRKGVLVAVGIFTFIMGAYILFQGGDEDPSTGTAPIDAAPGPVVSIETVPTTVAAEVEQSGDIVPSDVLITSLLTELVSGDGGRISDVVISPGSSNHISVVKSFWAGIGPSGLSVRPNGNAEARVDDQDVEIPLEAVQSWEIFDTESGVVVATVVATFRFEDSYWQFISFPIVSELPDPA